MSSTSSQMVQKKIFIGICRGDEERKKQTWKMVTGDVDENI